MDSNLRKPLIEVFFQRCDGKGPRPKQPPPAKFPTLSFLGLPMQARPTGHILDSALVRKANKIYKIYYYTSGNHVQAVVGNTDVPLTQVIIGKQPTSSAFKRQFMRNDPELLKIGNRWTCALCKIPAYDLLPPIQHYVLRAWLKHKVKCILVQDKLCEEVASSTVSVPTITMEPNSLPIFFEEDNSGVIRQITDADSKTSPETALVRARRAILENSALAGTIESSQVFCIKCKKWIRLTTGAYSATNWNRHLGAHGRRRLRQAKSREYACNIRRSTSPTMRMTTRSQTLLASGRAEETTQGNAFEGRVTRFSMDTVHSSDDIQASVAGPSRPAKALNTRRIVSSPLTPAPSSSNEQGSKHSSPVITVGDPREEIPEPAIHEAVLVGAQERAVPLADEEAGGHAMQNNGQGVIDMEAQAVGAEVVARGNAAQKVEFNIPQGVIRLNISYRFAQP